MQIQCKFAASSKDYACYVTQASITKPNVDIANFKGKHKPGKSNDDVIGIFFENLLVEYFPRNLQRIFPNLKTLRIRYCGLKEISREDLIGLEKLACLDLSDNQFKSLPDDLFSNMPSLKVVFLDCNRIEFASSKLIEPIVGNQLVCFDLTINASIDERFRVLDYSGCQTIQELMSMIDEKCKPPKPQPISKKPQPISKTANLEVNCCDAAERKFLKGFNELRLLARFTDFVIVVGPREFPVSRAVLALQSSVFSEIFEVKTDGRSASKLEISEVSAEAVEAFLDYIYERKLPGAQNVMEIFKLAAKYEVAKLKIFCEGIIRENHESSAFEIFKLAFGPHKSEELKVAAFVKLQEKFCAKLDGDLNLINNPEKLQKIVETFLVIVEAKKVLDEIIIKS